MKHSSVSVQSMHVKKISMQDKPIPMINPDFINIYFKQLCSLFHFKFYHFIRLPKYPTMKVLKPKQC